MNQEQEHTPRSERFRSAIAAFIDARREAKLKDKESDAKAASKYDYGGWLADAARSASQLQSVTHTLKATHGNARGSSLRVEPTELPARTEIGTHSLGSKYTEDVDGNAAALGILEFLEVEVEGHSLLDWFRDSDEDLLRVIHSNPEVALAWGRSFSLIHDDTGPASHEKAKQIYWLNSDTPSDDNAYHLLQPLFSSSLAHAVHASIQDVRFGETNKLARQAFRGRKSYEDAYRDYRGIAMRKLGGSKPQNVSLLNNKRAGVNYLLASVPPPKWSRKTPYRLLRINSAFGSFGCFDRVRPYLKALVDFLLSNPPSIMATRTRREGIEQALGGQLALFAESVRKQMGTGWTRNPECELHQSEKLWLDPERSELDPREEPPEAARDDAKFKADYDFGDWPDEVAARFASWLNERLRDAGITEVGDVEYRHWARQAIIDAAWPVPLQRRAGGGT